jgi:hypothetical protein
VSGAASSAAGSAAGRRVAAAPPLSITLAPDARDVGLATMLADLIGQSVEQNPAKRRDFDRLDTVIHLHVRDAGVTVSLAFAGGSLTIHGGGHGEPRIRISADAEAVLALCMIKIVAGIPHPLHHHNRKLLRMIATREIHVEGIPRSPLQLLRFARLVSVRG